MHLITQNGHQTTHKTKILLFSMEVDTNYGHTEAKFLILCGPNSNPNPKMGATSSAENTPNAPEFICRTHKEPTETYI